MTTQSLSLRQLTFLIKVIAKNRHSQRVTETRDKLFRELFAEYRQLLGYARALLPNEQMLEAMGLVVRW